MRPPNLGLQEKCPRDPLGAAIQVSPPTLCSTSRNALFAGPLLDGHEANPGRGSSRRSDKSRPGVGAVLRNKVRHPRRTSSPADSVHQLALGRTRQESRIPQQEFGQRTDPSDPCLWPRGPRLSVTDSVILGRRGPCQEEGRSNLREPLEEAGRQRLRRQQSRRRRTIVGRKDDDKYQRFFMPLLGPGRAFFRVEEISNGQSAARYHSHSEVDEYYLILDGSGTLRYHDKDVP